MWMCGLAGSMSSPPPSQQVVEAVARTEGTSPHELSTPLYDALEVDALDALATKATEPDASSIALTFAYLGYDIRVESDCASGVTVRVEAHARAEPEPTPVPVEEEEEEEEE